jgi:hypothetical protein
MALGPVRRWFSGTHSLPCATLACCLPRAHWRAARSRTPTPSLPPPCRRRRGAASGMRGSGIAWNRFASTISTSATITRWTSSCCLPSLDHTTPSTFTSWSRFASGSSSHSTTSANTSATITRWTSSCCLPPLDQMAPSTSTSRSCSSSHSAASANVNARLRDEIC